MAKTAERNLIDVPLYVPLDLARYFRVPLGLVIDALRITPPLGFQKFHLWVKTGTLPVTTDDDVPDVPALQERWSFRWAADLYVRLFAIESLIDLSREEMSERADVLREVARYILIGTPHALGFFDRERPGESGVSKLISACGDKLNDGEQNLLEKKLFLCLGRFDVKDNAPERLYPFSRLPVEDSPKVVVMDPAIRFGRPTVAGHGTPTDLLLERHQAGDSIADLAEDYGLSA